MSRTFPFFSPDVQQDPYPLYAAARAEEPIFFSDDLGMWVATRHADVTAILRDTERFSSRLTTVSVKEPPPEVVAVMRKGFPRTGSIIHLDPPEHTAVRRMMNAAFTADRIASKEGAVTALANDLVDSFQAEGRADLVKLLEGRLARPSADIAASVAHLDVAGARAERTTPRRRIRETARLRRNAWRRRLLDRWPSAWPQARPAGRASRSSAPTER